MSSSYPSLDDLALFLDVAASGSIGAVAARAGLTQPTLSRRMSALERDLGVTLLHRTRRGTELTEIGRTVADWALTLVQAADDFDHSVAALAGRGGSDLRLAASVTVAEHYVPVWLGALRQVDARVQPRLSIGNSEQVAAWVRHGDVELGFVETPDLPDDLLVRRLGDDPLVVAVTPGHRWAGEQISPSELASEPLLLREPGSGTRGTLELALAAHDLEPIGRMELTSNAALLASARAGLGPVVLSARAVAGDVEAGRLRPVEVTGLPLVRPLSAVIRRGTRLSSAARTLLDQI